MEKTPQKNPKKPKKNPPIDAHGEHTETPTTENAITHLVLQLGRLSPLRLL